MKLTTINNWHKVLGLIGTIFIILLSVTGILLLHTNEFNLQQRLVANGVILDWYDINPQQSPRSFRIADRWVIQLDEQVYLDRHAISATDEKLLGAINLEGIVVLGYENFIDLISDTGELIERVTKLHSLPTGIEMVGLGNDGRVYIKTNDAQFSSDLSSDHWEKNGNTNITWSNQSAVPVEHLDELLKIYRGTGLPLERVIVDLHSGRFMGKFGILIIDISVVIFIALSMTGWWSWFKRRAIQKEIDAED